MTEEEIVAAALDLSAVTPLEQVSMRALAGHLGVPVMTIYNYVPNKAALVELIQNRILAGIEVPDEEAGAWDERMRVLQRRARAVVGDQVGVRFGTGFGASAESARLADAVRDILTSAGFPPAEVSLAFTALFTFMLGQIEIDAIARATHPDGVGLLLPAGVEAPDRDEAFEYAFDVVLTGLKARLRPQPPRT